jgi:hypothetical protein
MNGSMAAVRIYEYGGPMLDGVCACCAVGCSAGERSAAANLAVRLLRRADLEIRKWLKQLRKGVRRNRTSPTLAGLSARSALRGNAATRRQTTAKRAAIRTSAITFPVTFGSVSHGLASTSAKSCSCRKDSARRRVEDVLGRKALEPVVFGGRVDQRLD